MTENVVLTGDCVEVMAGLEPESVDAIVTDPPYDLTSTGARNGSARSNAGAGPYARLDRGGFMGKTWDGTGVAFRQETWELALRVAKPSAYLLAFGGTRTVHRMTVALEDAGWIIRDMLVWAYASGFPKSKASLKPAWEPIVMARKPGPLRMLAIDECRIGERDESKMYVQPRPTTDRDGASWSKGEHVPFHYGESGGRWPANVILTDPIFDGDTEGVVGGGETSSGLVRAGSVIAHNDGDRRTYDDFGGMVRTQDSYGDAGTYSRFFVLPKADRTDREPVLAGLEPRFRATMDGGEREPVTEQNGTAPRNGAMRANHHPTVKPTELMRHLVRLVTPPGGLVLDPFLGSGTTAIACELEGFRWLGIEKEPEYVAIAEARLNGTQRGMGLSA